MKRYKKSFKKKRYSKKRSKKRRMKLLVARGGIRL